MQQDQSADTDDLTRGGVSLRTWLTRGKYLLLELGALILGLGFPGYITLLLSAFRCMAPGQDETEGRPSVVYPADFDPVVPFAVMVLMALAGIAVWGAYRVKPMVWKTQAVLALVTVVAAFALHDPHPTCTRYSSAGATQNSLGSSPLPKS
ncbi:hypothetical protein [Streptomyces sp. NPDC003483]